MTEPIVDHDRLDVDRRSIQYTADAFDVAKDLSGLRRDARDQWLRAAQSIPLSITSTSTAMLSTSTKKTKSQNQE